MHRVILSAGLALLVLPLTVIAQSPTAGASGSQMSDQAADELFARDTYRVHTIVCPFKGEIEYEPGEIECGLLQVPENREKPDSRFIELHFVKVNTTWDDEADEEETEADEPGPAPGKRDDPVVYLTGGPGARVTYYVKRLKEHGLVKHRDLYILEQRGIGYSDDFCPYYHIRKPEAGNVATFEEHLQAGIDADIECAVNATAKGVDLAGYNSFENARDVKALRRALGFDQWNVWGISYGSILGQAYLEVDPEGIRAIALDAIMPLDVRNNTWAWQSVSWYDRDLQKLDELCQGQKDCAKRYPDLGERVRQAIVSVRDNPIVVDIKDNEAFPTGKAYFFTDVVGFLPFAFMYEQSNYPGLPGLIYAWADAVERREETLFKALALVGGRLFDGSPGMSNAILCLDGDIEAQVTAGTADIEAHPILGSAIGSVAAYQKGADLCREYGMAPRDAAEYIAVETDLPALLIEGDMDPITPPPLAKAILPGFANAIYLEFPWAGHGPSRSVECAGDMLNLFFDQPAAEPDLSCVDEMEPPEFYVPLFTTTFAPRTLVRAMEDKKSLIVPAVWGGSSVLISALALLTLSVAPIGRRIDRRRASAAGWARTTAWLASFLAVVSVIIIGAAIGVTFKSFEALLLFGLVPWARWGAVAGLLAGVIGVTTIVVTLRSHPRYRLPFGTLLGFLLTGFAAVSLSVFLLIWDLGVF